MESLSRRQFLSGGLLASASVGFMGCSGLSQIMKEGSRPMNVLFIAVDDLRPELGCYGVSGIKTPNIDALAARGTSFTRAYCQQAVCNPSRASLLTGLRPDTIQVHDLETHFRFHCPKAVTLPQHFMQHGYHTQSFSKIYHGGLDDPLSWLVSHTVSPGPVYTDPETQNRLAQKRQESRKKGRRIGRKILQKDEATGTVLKTSRKFDRIKGPSWECGNVSDEGYRDGLTAKRATAALREIKDKPFFLAVGFIRPHLPFTAPKRYFDLYSKKDLNLADNPYPPKDCPDLALTRWAELRKYENIPSKGPLGEEKALKLIHAYYACVSYIDAQIGKLLDELDRLGLRHNTVVVLWGDHGWQLGEHGLWCKHTNFEIATRVPMIISAPGQSSPGSRCDALVEFVDIYPTLADLCGLPIPNGLEGLSLVPLLNGPNRLWKSAAFSQYPRKGGMGYSMRTDRFRYTEWRKEKKILARELYDHQTDEDENTNLANLPQYKTTVEALSKKLGQGWQAALPMR